MVDHDSLLISYRAWRGEPRGPHKVGQILGGQGRLHRLPAMRGGLPDRHRHPQRLAARMHPMRAVHRCLQRDHGQGRQAARARSPTTRSAISRRRAPRSFRCTWLRPRVILYATLMAIVGVIMLTALVLRPELEVSVLHDRNPLYVKLSDGGLRNGYTVKLLNKLYEPRSFKHRGAGACREPRSASSAMSKRPIRWSRSRRTSSSRSVSMSRSTRPAYAALPDSHDRVLLHRHRYRERHTRPSTRELPGAGAMTERGLVHRRSSRDAMC